MLLEVTRGTFRCPLNRVPEAPRAAPGAGLLPAALLYATSAGLGGSGLDSTSFEGALASHRGGFLRRAISYGSRQGEIPRRRIQSLQFHPVRLLSCLGSADYYAAKKLWLDRAAARALRGGSFDFYHGWSGECFRALVEARLRGIPSAIDVATWHRNKGALKPAETKSEREARLADRGWRDWRRHLRAGRLQHLAEYDLADVLLMPSLRSAETFRAAGISEERLHYVGRGVDLQRYQPSTGRPDKFRAVFVGALIRRKGVHHLLAAWRKLALKNSELVLVGAVHDEIKPDLAGPAEGIRLVGFTADVRDELRRASVFVFPSACEGFAKATLEAAACGLPLIATRESGDAIVDGETGWLVPPDAPGSLADAISQAAARQDELPAIGARARQRVASLFTWDHYRQRLLHGYALARERCGSP